MMRRNGKISPKEIFHGYQSNHYIYHVVLRSGRSGGSDHLKQAPSRKQMGRRNHGHGHIGYAEAMMLEYNSKNKHRLSIRQRPYYSFLKNKEVICKMICPHMGTEVEIKTRRNICDVLLLTFIAAKGMI
jgi:hypothetical protein